MKTEKEQIMQELELIKTEKNKIVRNQNYGMAQIVKANEKDLLSKLEKIDADSPPHSR